MMNKGDSESCFTIGEINKWIRIFAEDDYFVWYFILCWHGG